MQQSSINRSIYCFKFQAYTATTVLKFVIQHTSAYTGKENYYQIEGNLLLITRYNHHIELDRFALSLSLFYLLYTLSFFCLLYTLSFLCLFYTFSLFCLLYTLSCFCLLYTLSFFCLLYIHIVIYFYLSLSVP